MKPASILQHLAAAAIAVFVTTSTVWGMASLGYPANTAPAVSVKGDCSAS